VTQESRVREADPAADTRSAWRPAGPAVARELPRHQATPPSLASELKRKAIHLSALAIPIGYYFVPEARSRQILLVLLLLFLLVDMLRLETPRVRWLFSTFFGDILRRHEKGGELLASTYLLFASLLTTYAIRQKQVAIAALSFLIIGDTVAALVGRRWGRVRLFRKSLEGSLACFLSCLVVSYVLMSVPPPGSTAHPVTWSALLVGSLVATIVEVLPIPLDDNFRIPLASGIAMLTVLGLG
jgi:dolichol kinase